MNSRAIEDEDEERGQWGSKAEFILSCIGFSVSDKNVLCVVVRKLIQDKDNQNLLRYLK